MKTNRGRFINGMIVGLILAVLVRGAFGCGAESSEQAENNDVAAEAAPVETTDTAADEDIIDLENAVCPVMGNPVQEGVYLDWEGYRIHFCCAGCDRTFLSDPETYLDILSRDSVVADKLGRTSIPQ
ncbi:MAG: hypothetical protein GF388_06895 [Candidatus Aegiribacteria sp.]|nr:hypothetical protein [Candidatus Aegiribacteria sp.]MBD3294873.1 hypothetical protein [Candidatus Fermentibacteria bacterium]